MTWVDRFDIDMFDVDRFGGSNGTSWIYQDIITKAIIMTTHISPTILE